MRTFEEIEKLAIDHHFITIDGMKYEIELVNTDNQVIIVYDGFIDEYLHFQYQDLTENVEFSSKYETYTVKIPEVYMVEIEVQATSEEEAKELAATIYSDKKIDHLSLYDHAMNQSDWIVDY